MHPTLVELNEMIIYHQNVRTIMSLAFNIRGEIIQECRAIIFMGTGGDVVTIAFREWPIDPSEGETQAQ